MVVEQIRRTRDDDPISAFGGNDLVFGQDGNDGINGNAGNDRLLGDRASKEFKQNTGSNGFCLE
ncbi:MAG: hypothetical protein GDA56_12130 [Hormoscilla sp. GM7CHS1pb]|nr:hypothetical protein [Hormoscilla sp. GM7CHS1pb]